MGKPLLVRSETPRLLQRIAALFRCWKTPVFHSMSMIVHVKSYHVPLHSPILPDKYKFPLVSSLLPDFGHILPKVFCPLFSSCLTLLNNVPKKFHCFHFPPFLENGPLFFHFSQFFQDIFPIFPQFPQKFCLTLW